MRFLILLVLGCCATSTTDTDAGPSKAIVECDPFCSTVDCPAIEICVESVDDKATGSWYDTGEGSEFVCNGADCTAAAAELIDYCGACL